MDKKTSSLRSTPPALASQAPRKDVPPDGVITVDEQHRIVGISQSALRMFGCTAAEVLNRPLSRLIPTRYRSAHEQKLRDFVESTSAQRHIMGQGRLVVGLRADGEEFPIEVIIHRVEVTTPAGPASMFTALVRDLGTKPASHSAAEADAGTARRRMLAVLDLAPVAIWITEHDQIVFANAACATLFGADSPQVLVGRQLFDLLSEDSPATVREKMAQVLAADTPVAVVNERIARLDGRRHEVEIAIAALPEHGHGVLQMVITDRTLKQRERRAAERTRRSLQRIAHMQVQARDGERQRIARELHDELGQRLVALKIELALLEELPGVTKALGDRAAVALQMVDGLFSEIRRLACELRPKQLDHIGLNAAIEALAGDMARRLALDIRLRLHGLELPQDHPAPAALYRVVQEGLTNAVRHARATRIDIETRMQGDDFVLIIQDNGVGFGKRPAGGNGSMGLVGMRERAQLMGGRLLLSNGPGGGARIELHLPLREITDRGHADATLSSAALAHELQVHQIELENQNDELRRTQLALAAARDRYADLYDFAPVAYVTLNAQGRLVGLNLTAANMLGLSRAQLMNARFEQYVASADSLRWQRALTDALGHDRANRIELTIKPQTGNMLSAQVDCRRVAAPAGSSFSLRMTLTDVSHLKLAAMDRRIAASAVAARENDRRRVAVKLHEDLGQQLCALKMGLAQLEAKSSAALEPERFDEMMAALDVTLESVRSLASELRPMLLDNLGLMAALEWLGHELSHRSGVEIAQSLDTEDPPLDEVNSVALYRLAEQLLTQGVQGAGPGQCLSLSLHRQAQALVLTVERDGSGWAQASPALERRELDELARVVGGQLDLDGSAGSGWAARVHIPIPPDSGSGAAMRPSQGTPGPAAEPPGLAAGSPRH